MSNPKARFERRIERAEAAAARRVGRGGATGVVPGSDRWHFERKRARQLAELLGTVANRARAHGDVDAAARLEEIAAPLLAFWQDERVPFATIVPILEGIIDARRNAQRGDIATS